MRLRAVAAAVCAAGLTAALAGCSGGDEGGGDAPVLTEVSGSGSASATRGAQATTRQAAERTSEMSTEQRCDPATVAAAGFEGYTYSSFCDGQWNRVGVPQTDDGRLLHWENGTWVEYERDGTTTWGMAQACYDPARLAADGMPAELRAKVAKCDEDPGRSQASSSTSTTPPLTSIAGLRLPECDGRGILIVESVLVEYGVNAQSVVHEAMARHPGAHSTEPGQCSSLRAKHDGATVYPIYYDHGFDRAALCADKAARGGNARTLNNDGDFSDPC
ncbi:hypothetical protein [Corynebacterium frankenforstense]|uniref:hypothetical protein n=1 Tax=Corynebacterium frankenforstense TaxID=1230998 RepID=UPI0026ED7087|nr:hypothetical protein [Corynebacterium frankenforstense]